ncbi:ATP-binding protein [Streptomyces sp. HNM0663]|uniref:ATP-binding protein n=1 Tax=Streptomyces chengmaiensis TaxID=3040919 RepID=A0ABT6HPM0_9ACTN|nr:ATP-binding protein [Streptomyces chengmaiensis]MDH2390672.1 ATP-binding protein [Streptomyces chengmaiensis]
MITVEKTRSAASGPPCPNRTAGAARAAVCVMPASTESVPALRRFARDMARRWALSEVLDEALAVIITELAANAVRHSGSPDVAVLLVAADGTITVHVQDTGRWYPWPPAPRVREDEAGDTACCGRGLRLVEAYAARSAVMITAGGTRVTAELVMASDGPSHSTADHRAS